MMEGWTHSICNRCWDLLRDNEPVTMTPEHLTPEPYCACGDTHTSGIYVRAEPTLCHPRAIEARLRA